MNVFFSDLDNTLIYSHRRTIAGNKIPVEWLNGKEQSYMTEYTYGFLRDAEWLSLIPVTTRTEAQYRRIMLQELFNIHYALICNGGKLLIDGNEDSEWSKETLEGVQNEIPDLEKLGKELQSLCGKQIHRPEIYYYYGVTDEPEKVCSALRRRNLNPMITIDHDHRKVYLFPRKVNKGEAVKRFEKAAAVNTRTGAGDSSMDIAMLNEMDYAMSPLPVFNYISCANKIALKGEIISDQICNELADLHLKGII